MARAKNGSTKKQKKTSRQLAVLCLKAWSGRKEPIGPLVETIIHKSALQPADRHLAVNLVQGVLRQKQYLDNIIARFSKFPLQKMKTLTRMTLRVGVFQIMVLDRIPDSAAVNETVNVMKLENQPRWLVNFVNGVLRSVVRNKDTLQKPYAGGSGSDKPLNHPDWLVTRWQKRYGSELTRTICLENNKEPLLTLRVNTLRSDPEAVTGLMTEAGYAVRPGKYVTEALVLLSFTGPLTNLPGYDEGLFHIQDEAAQLVTHLLGPFSGPGIYLDGCAGLGGKTCQLAQMVSAGSKLFAVEPERGRLELLKKNLARLRSGQVSLFHGRLDEFISEDPGEFTGVLIDAPCSGTGVIGRHPDIRWNRTPDDLPGYARQQLDLLEQGASLVAPGGVLVYATCSMEPEENKSVIDRFLGRHDDFSVTDCRLYLPAGTEELVTEDGFFVPTPANGIDGFFGARLIRNG